MGNNKLIKTAFILSLLMLIWSSAVFGHAPKDDNALSGVKFEVLSQRWLTKQERGDSITLNTAVRVRLSNKSDNNIFFSSFDNGSIYPPGFHYTRKSGETEWKRLSPDNTFTGLGYRNLILSPGMVIECDFSSMSIQNVEQRFSVLVRFEKEGKQTELFTDIFIPILN